MKEKNIDIANVIVYSFSASGKYFIEWILATLTCLGTLLGAGVILALPLFYLGTISAALGIAWIIIAFIFYFIFMSSITAGFMQFILNLHDTGKTSLGILFSKFNVGLRLFFANTLTTLITGIGLIFFILPGFYMAARLSIASYLIVNQNMGIVDALKKSFSATKDTVWPLVVIEIFFFSITLGIDALFYPLRFILIFRIIFLIVRVILVFNPINALATAKIYRTLIPETSRSEF